VADADAADEENASASLSIKRRTRFLLILAGWIDKLQPRAVALLLIL
jgi:hypothetical protein